MTRITVVEDVVQLREDVCDILRKAGHEVEGASDGMGLSRLLLRFAPEIVVLDIGLPDENGLEIARRLRAQQPTTRTAAAPGTTDGWRLDIVHLTIVATGGLAFAITSSEPRVLEMIARSPRRQCDRRELASALGEAHDRFVRAEPSRKRR